MPPEPVSPEFLYRFRSAKALLPGNAHDGYFDELQKQSIFFASPDALNDPMEDFKDIFWRGDEIAWRNFFNHFVLCLEYIQVGSMIVGIDRIIEEGIGNHIPVFINKNDQPTPEKKELVDSILKLFNDDPTIQELIKTLGASTHKVRRNEIEWLLSLIYPHAHLCIRRIYTEKALLNQQAPSELQEFQDLSQTRLTQLSKYINAAKKHDDNLEEIFTVLLTQISSFILAHGFERSHLEFEKTYLKEIEKLIFPKWHTSCFVSQYHNPLMWSHYADAHKGVCLIFQPQQSNDGIGLPITSCTGYGGSRNNTKRSYSEHPISFHKVDYAEAFPEIDFFRSLGRTPIGTLESTWFRDDNGNRSVCAIDDSDDFRSEYWKSFYKHVCTKTSEWEYEDEYRLVLASALGLYDDPNENRALPYSFDSLAGVIWGINTEDKDKTAIMKIIKDKCDKHKRHAFKFYQAYYSHKSKQIQIVECLKPIKQM